MIWRPRELGPKQRIPQELAAANTYRMMSIAQ
jgi:hypothetical protein